MNPIDPRDPASGRRGTVLLRQDDRGRTPLFYAAEEGLHQEVREMIFSLPGTGIFPGRLHLIELRDHEGLTAADVAERNGHHAIAELLRGEMGRMEHFE